MNNASNVASISSLSLSVAAGDGLSVKQVTSGNTGAADIIVTLELY